MKILLDTHIALWAIADSKKLSSEVITILKSVENEIYYSIASVWEVAIKHKLHPDKMPISEQEFVEFCEKAGFIELSITAEQIYLVSTLERPKNALSHNDPFDRLMIAQAKKEQMKFMTHDTLIPWYNEPCIYSV